MKKLKIFLDKFKFGYPPSSDVVIFNKNGSDVIIKTVLEGIRYCVLDANLEVFYLSPKLFALMLLNMHEADFFKLHLPDLKTAIRRIVGQFYRIYLLSCLHLMKPRIVLTYLDDSAFFHFVSRKYRSAQFYAITNGFRVTYPVVIGPDDPKISMPNLICHGKLQEDLYRRYGHHIDNFHLVGSLQGGYYRAEMAADDNSIDFDLCLVSQCIRTIMSKARIVKGSTLSETRKAIMTLDAFLVRYLEENDITFCVALRRETPFEIAYFSRVYGEKAVLIMNKRLSMSTYRAMERSSVIVTTHSSAAVEAYEWGKKVLFTNFSGTDSCKIPVADACYLDENSYLAFKKKLDFVRSLSEDEYHALTRNNRNYLSNYNPEYPAHIFVRDLVNKHCRK